MGTSVSRSFNRAVARPLKRYPDRFIGVATAPLQDVRLGIAEAEYAIKELGLHAVIIYQNVNGKDLDGEFLWTFYERIEALDVPLLIHGVDRGTLLGLGRFARFNVDGCLALPFD